MTEISNQFNRITSHVERGTHAPSRTRTRQLRPALTAPKSPVFPPHVPPFVAGSSRIQPCTYPLQPWLCLAPAPQDLAVQPIPTLRSPALLPPRAQAPATHNPIPTQISSPTHSPIPTGSARQMDDSSAQEVNPEANPSIAHAGPAVVQQVDESSAQEVNPEINPSIVHEGSASSLAVLGEARAPNQEPASPRRRRRRVDALRWVIPPPAPPGWGWRGEGRIIVTAGAGHRVFAIFPGQREVRVLVRVDSNGVQTIVRSPGRQRRPG